MAINLHGYYYLYLYLILLLYQLRLRTWLHCFLTSCCWYYWFVVSRCRDH